MRRSRIGSFAVLAAGVIATILVIAPFVHYTAANEIGITRNVVTGEIGRDHPGWNLSAPWVMAAHVDTRPMRVCVSSTAHAYNCRLAQFVPDFYQEFVEVEGFRYYWWANRLSFNLGYDEEYRGMRDVLRGYAYDIRPYAFVRVTNES